MNSPYRTYAKDLPATGTGRTDATGIVPRGNPVIAVTVLTLPAAAVNASNIGYVSLIVGEGSDPIRVNQQGLTWYAQRDAAGQPIPELSGVFLSAGDALSGGHPSILGLELYVEMLHPRE